MRICDYHLHSEFSFDSSEKIERICEKAVQFGISEIAITDHVEFPKDSEKLWPDFNEREKAIALCRKMFDGRLLIREGAEIGQPWLTDKEITTEISPALDFILASVHSPVNLPDPHDFVFSEDNVCDYMYATISQLTMMAAESDYDVLAHVTYLFRFVPAEILDRFPPESFLNEYRKLFRAVIDRGKGIEINCSGLRMPSIRKTLPSVDFIKLFREMGGEIITIGSDGHSCRSAFSGLEAGYEAARDAGFRYAVTYEDRKPGFYRI